MLKKINLFILVALTLMSSSFANLENDTLTYGSFDEETIAQPNNKYNDLSSNSADYTCSTGNCTDFIYEKGLLREAVTFDNSSEKYLSLSLNEDLGENFTISTWFKSNYSDKNQQLLGFTITSVGNVVYTPADMSGQIVSNQSGYNDGQWHNIIYSQDNGTGNLYLDNQLVGTDSNFSELNSNVFRIGNFDLINADNRYVGQLDEFIVFNSSLNDSQISSIYNNGEGNNYLYVAPETPAEEDEYEDTKNLIENFLNVFGTIIQGAMNLLLSMVELVIILLLTLPIFFILITAIKRINI